VGPLEEAFAAGEFGALLEWVGENIHRHGKRFPAVELVEKATGNMPDTSALITSLSSRYRPAP
jgi:carboxypeptidase Taq